MRSITRAGRYGETLCECECVCVFVRMSATTNLHTMHIWYNVVHVTMQRQGESMNEIKTNDLMNERIKGYGQKPP